MILSDDELELINFILEFPNPYLMVTYADHPGARICVEGDALKALRVPDVRVTTATVTSLIEKGILRQLRDDCPFMGVLIKSELTEALQLGIELEGERKRLEQAIQHFYAT